MPQGEEDEPQRLTQTYTTVVRLSARHNQHTEYRDRGKQRRAAFVKSFLPPVALHVRAVSPFPVLPFLLLKSQGSPGFYHVSAAVVDILRGKQHGVFDEV